MTDTPRTARRTHGFTESVIREMIRFAAEHEALNLAQGFPDFPAPEALKVAASGSTEEPAALEEAEAAALEDGRRGARVATSPQALDWTGTSLMTRLSCDFLLKRPTLEAVRRARPETVRSFYSGHNCRHGDRIEQRLQQIRTATPLTTDSAIIDVSVLTVQMLARQIRELGPAIARYEEDGICPPCGLRFPASGPPPSSREPNDQLGRPCPVGRTSRIPSNRPLRPW
ncbi:MAG: hypothetical protein R6U63_12970 [Longimicrobiales bacterium]